MKNNREIRKAAHNNGVTLSDVADYLGVTPKTVYAWLRIELTGTKKEKFLQAIEATRIEKFGE
ncbi:MAG: hypothetical protein IJK60_10050 [Clostridia bacterium]|nr:hypothetical protein [Clostridia bacterium]